jgi:ribosomal protein S18 acetylase RimI-like enzyme
VAEDRAAPGNELGPDDADDAAAFLQLAYTQAYAGRHAITAEMFAGDAFRQRMATALRERLGRPDVVLLGRRDGAGRLLATIGLRADSDDRTAGEIWGFYVDAPHQSRGYGTALWDALMADPRTASHHRLYLHVVDGSDGAVEFYRRRGFTIDGDAGSWEWPTWSPPVHTPYRTMRRT